MLFESVNLWILNRINKLTRLFGKRSKALVIFTCFVIIALIFSLDPRNAFDRRRMSAISLVLIILISACVEGEIKPVRWNLIPALTIELFALSMIVVIPIHPVGQGYMIFAFDILILFPMLYMAVLNRANRVIIIDYLSFAIMIAGIICFVLSVILIQGQGWQLPDGRVPGLTKNPNYYGMVGLAIVMSGLYNLARNRNNIAWRVITALSTGIGISMIVVSVARTAILSALFCVVAYIIYFIKMSISFPADNGDRSYLASWKRYLALAAILLLVIFSAIASVRLQQRAVSTAQSSNNIHFVSIHYISLIPVAYAEDEGDNLNSEQDNTVIGRFSPDDDIDSFSSGRVGIWKRYCEYLNIIGNDYDAAKKIGVFNDLPESRAHNNIIDYAYRFGIPSGLLYVVFYIAVNVESVLMLRKKRFTAYDLWVVMTVVSYAVYAMIEISTLPFTRYIPCLFFLSAAPLMGEPSESKESEF